MSSYKMEIMKLAMIALVIICPGHAITYRDIQCDYIRANNSEASDNFSLIVRSQAGATVDGYVFLDHKFSDFYRYATVGEDFVAPNVTLSSPVVNFTLTPHSSKTFTGSVIDDSISEYVAEYFTFHAGVYDSDKRLQCCNYSYYIHDNDGLRFEHSWDSITVPEHAGTVELCVIHYGGDNVPSVINATFVGTNHADGGDIKFNTTKLVFSVAVGDKMCFNVTIIDDNELDDNIEYFYFYIDNLSERLRNRHYYDRTQINVMDNEVFRYGLEKSSYTVMESDGVVTVCAVVYETNVTDVFTADISAEGLGDARDGDDFRSTRQKLKISRTLNKSCINIRIINDSIPEQYEIFQVSLGIHGGQEGHSRSIVIITDDDNVTCTPGCINGECIFPGVCQCHKGWINDDCSIATVCQQPCVHGMCNIDIEQCDCCEVVRRCNIDNGGCDQICTDFPGGYNCSCYPGFIPLTSDSSFCGDIDECASEESNDCSQICVNTPGSYYCNCERGYQLVNGTQCLDVNECVFSLCDQMCINTNGSFHCECREGYKLFGSLFCNDIDECLQGIDNCTMTGSAPARCSNTQGSFFCTCDIHMGYQLSSDGTTCEEVDECMEEGGSKLCHQICENTPGSYQCACHDGFTLQDDLLSCSDKNECETMNGGCQHTCTNTPGDFTCSCNQGYVLTDRYNCEAQSCDPVLEAPANGSMICDRQTVGGTCSFTCDESYTLRGSESRICLPSLQWSGPPAICDPPMCPYLSPPENGFVLFPCTREEGHVCCVVCAHGYAIEGPSNQTCRKSSSGNVVWTEGPLCVESRPCSSDTCQNGGYCIEGEGTEFTCVCNGTATGYGGTNCDIVIVYFLPIPPVMEGNNIVVSLHTDITKDFNHKVRVRVSRPNQRQVITVTEEEPVTSNFRSEVGLVTVTLQENPEGIIYEPRERYVFVRSQAERESYFEQLNLTRGLLQPGCCHGDVMLSCPSESTKSVSLFSSCQWSRNTRINYLRTDGVVFANVDSFFLPISISGMRYKDDPGDYINDIKPNSACQTCSECQSNSDSCVCYIHTVEDTFELLQARALAYTYISNIQDLLPPWLNLTVDLTLTVEDDTPTRNDLFAQITQLTESVSLFEGCDRLSGLVGSRYSVMRYDKTISAVIDGQRYDYTETGTTGDVMCFVVDLCHESESPVHIQISQSINNFLVLQYLRQFTDRGWDITINTISFYKQPFSLISNKPFWNGRETFQQQDSIIADVSVDAHFTAIFTIASLCIKIKCSGKSSANFRVITFLNGSMELVVKSMINGDDKNFFITTAETEAYTSIEGINACNTRDSGMFFSTNYRPLASDQFFTRLFLFNETTSSCPFNAFIPMTSDYTVLGISLHTQCPLLAIGELILPEISHNLTFIQSSNKNCFTTNFFGATNPALVIESNLVNPHLQLGNIFTLQSYSGGPDVVTVFERERSGPVSLFHSVAVTMFGGRFESEARVRNDELTISSSNASVFGYPAEITITAPTNKTDWQNLELNVEGSLLNHGENSFIEALRNTVIRELKMLGDSASARRKIAEQALNHSVDRANAVKSQYKQALMDSLQAKEQVMEANQSINEARETLQTLERQFNESQKEIKPLLDIQNLCEEKYCEDICMPGELCRSCSKPIFVEKASRCRTVVTEQRTVRIPPLFYTRTTYKLEIRCQFQNNMVCFIDQCPVGVEKRCTGRSIPVFDTCVPAYHWISYEIDVPSFKSCVLTVYNSSVPGQCCDNVTCAVRAPDASCEASNAMCRALRKSARENATDIGMEIRELFKQLVSARSNLSLAITAKRRAELEYERQQQRIEQLEPTLNRVRSALEHSQAVYNKTIEDVMPLLGIYESGKYSNCQNVFNITSVTFKAKLTNSRTSLPFTVSFENLINHTQNQESYLLISTRSQDWNLERMADDIIETAFFDSSKRSTWLHTRLRRQTETDALTPREVFASHCAHVSNTLLFFTEILIRLTEILIRLTEIQDVIISSRQGASQLSDSLSQQGPQEDAEYQAYLGLIRSYEDLSIEGVRVLENTIFSEWQASMELLYSESGSVGEVSCDGLADCLQTAVDQLRFLISLTPENELSSEFLSLRSNFPRIANDLLNIAVLSNISIDEGVSRVVSIVDLTNAYVTSNYWCSEPPIIITQPPSEANVSLGDTLELSCEAQSNLSVMYRWTRDGNVLPQFTKNQLVIDNLQRQDSANYTCFASNPVGTAESVTTSVTVYELPEFYLLPESVVTYLGDGNGAWFACNATGWPYPGWKWYYRSNSNQNWTLIEGEETNELLIENPQEENQGMYVCEAFNDHGRIQSPPVTLTLLPFTVSVQMIPIQLSVFNPNGSSLVQDIYDTPHYLISDTISGETATIKEFNVTELDSEHFDVSLNLVSYNITTRFTHLSTFGEIGNTALPHLRSLRKSTQLIRELLNTYTESMPIPGTGSVVVEEDSVIEGRLSYVCPPGQRLNSDYLLCVSCELGHYSSGMECSRIVNGVGLTENVPVCNPCPLYSYADTIGSDTCTQCPKYHSTSSTATVSLDQCIPQPLVLECESETTSGHFDIDCRTNRPPQTTLCSFNGGLKHPCTYPVAINRDVSPLGNHSLTIFVEDDEGFQAQTTVTYLLQDDSKPTITNSLYRSVNSDTFTPFPPASPVVPPLVVKFIKDSPRVQGDSVEADILLSRPVRSLVCRLIMVQRYGNFSSEKDCSSGHVMFTGLSPAVYTLIVIATNRKPDKEFVKTRLEITNDSSRCTLHFINDGVSVEGDSATVEFTGRGPIRDYSCQLDKMEFFQCSNPVMLNGLSSGEHFLKVVPHGCGRNRMILKTNINIE